MRHQPPVGWPAAEVCSALATGEPGEAQAWCVLVVDRDPEVHGAVRGALQGRHIRGRALASLHAHSLAEAYALLPGLQAGRRAQGLVLVLLDAALQASEHQPDAHGPAEPSVLALADRLRFMAGLEHIRIVLRTAGFDQTPDAETLLRHGIHDDRSKPELTRERLLALVANALHARQQLQLAHFSCRSLERVVRASASLLEAASPGDFAEGVIDQLATVLGCPPDGVACVQASAQAEPRVLAATGRFACAALGRPELALVRESLERGAHIQRGDGARVFYIGRRSAPGMAVFMHPGADVPTQAGTALLDAFCAHLCILLHKHGLLTRLHEQAYYDPLVGLPNRVRFVEKVDECARQGVRNHVLALFDIDDFSATNDVMGHRFGDRLLQQVADRLTQALPSDVLLARLGADTFGVLGSAQQVLPERVLEGVRQPLTVDGLTHKVSLTCGYVRLPEAPQAGTDLVKDATIALKRAKRDHRGHHLEYSEHMGAEARARALLVSDLRAAIDQEQLFLVYQPQLDLTTRALVGLEALLRWRTEDGTLVPPDRFIPVAEHSGLIVTLGQWVLSNACAAMRELLDAGLAPRRMAVNVSAVQLQDPGFFDMVRAALARSGLQGVHLELEITESVAALPTQLLEATLSRLRASGVSIAIDDFGTGYSSLSYLERLPLDRIKIDRAFVRNLGQSHGARIAEMVAQLGRKLGLQVLAEGIEDTAAWQAMMEMGCHEGQGYYIARPMEKSQLVSWLRLRQ
jgi:diguanylate cyclase (GGDEF)-like protein